MNETLVALVFLFGISATANVALGVTLWRAGRRLKRLEGREPTPVPLDARAERLEQVVDSLSVQVEQLASGQDFLNRVVSERLDKIARGLPAGEGGPAPGAR
ncbi:MAG TPA: hypothetical protein VMF70_10915 [Gemmatimonadales bacterium]|nr:hypothetical protein [Gemmatimonadales bacterium]